MNLEINETDCALLLDAIVERRFGLRDAINNERKCTNNTDTIATLERQYTEFGELADRIKSEKKKAIFFSAYRDVVYDAHDKGLITAVELRRALRELARTSHLTVKTRKSTIRVTEEGIACDCGKGILCSYNVQIPNSSSISK